MTAHNHTTHIEGCFRCDISKHEADEALKARVDAILANDDTEYRHEEEDALYEEIALANASPEERAQLNRLQDADLPRWYA